MDRLQTLTVFVAVADEGGFAPAARKLNLSPPAVTRAVAALEARLGCRLLHRTTRNVRLTETGERYVADCRRILGELDEADRLAIGAHTEPRGMITISSSILFGRMIITPIIQDLLDRYPALSVTGLFVDRVTHLLEDGVDIAVRIGPLADSSHSAIRVGELRHVLCASPDYVARHGRPRTPSDLNRHTIVDFVNMTPGGLWSFGPADTPTTFRPAARFRVNNADAAIAAVLSGQGITRVLSYMVAGEIENGTLEPLLRSYEPNPVPVHVLHKEPHFTSARVRATADFLVDRLRAIQLHARNTS